MKRTSLWVAVAIVLIVAVLGVAWQYHKSKLALNTAAGIANATPDLTAPGAPFFGTLVSSTPTSVTAKGMDGATKTFAITPQTPVVSTVLAGVIAGTLAKTRVGTQIEIVLDPKNPAAVQNIQIIVPPPLPPPPPPGSDFVTIAGTVLSHSSTNVVIQKQPENKEVTIFITKNTKVISDVPASYAGKTLGSLTDHASYISVQAVKTGTVYNADIVQILIPIGSANQ